MKKRRNSSGARTGQSLFGTFIVVALAAAWMYSSRNAREQLIDPAFGLVAARDQSHSFSGDQFKANLKTHDDIYSSSFSSEAVAYEYIVFGKDMVPAGSATTSSARDCWPLLAEDVSVDPSASCLELPLARALTLVKSHPRRTYGVLLLSDGQATDWTKVRQQAEALSRYENLAYVVVAGVIPSSRLPLAQAMSPLGDRFIQFDVADVNRATFLKVGSLVETARRPK